jgi:hypothetical protein
MPFIGNQPALSYTSFAKQDFTTSATTSYTLDNPVANANELALFINFVRQEPGSYSASGTTLTLTEATSSSDDMYAIFLGKAIQTVNPPNASVGTSQLADNGVTTAKIANDAVTFDKLTGQNYPAFSSKMTSNQSLSLNTNTKLNFSTELIDTDNAYDHSSNYRFTVPSGKSGKYVFSLQAFARGGAVGQFNYIVLKIYKNGSQLLSTIHNDSTNSGYGATGNVVVMDDASVGDYYEPFIFANATGLTVDVTDQGGCDHFYGYRIGD